MKLLKLNKKILIFLFIALFVPMNLFSISTAQNSSTLTLMQQIPNIEITSFILSNNLPEEGDEITATIVVENNDAVNYTNLLIQITLIQPDDGPGDVVDDIVVGNEIIRSLSADGSVIVELTFMAPAGEYNAIAVVVFNNLPIQNSEKSISLQIKGPKVGDNQTLILSIVILALFFILLLLGQATYDTIKLKNVILNSNGK